MYLPPILISAQRRNFFPDWRVSLEWCIRACMSATDELVDPGPLARFEAVKGKEDTPSVVFQRVSEGESLREVAKSWQVPAGVFTKWYATEHADLYDAALRVRADQLAHESLGIADEQEEVVKKDGSTFDPDVGRDKLRIGARQWAAGKWDRARYGEQVKVDRTITVAVDAGLVGFAAALLEQARPTEKVLPKADVEDADLI